MRLLWKKILQGRLALILVVSASFPGIYPLAASADTTTKTVYGESAKLGEGTVRTYVMHDAQGNPVSLGIEMTENVLAKLPEKDIALNLKFPAAVQRLQYNFARVDWHPQGHEPPGIYDVPHFDFHFYMETPEKVGKIAAGADPVVVAPAFMPADFISPGNKAIPGMGVHWVDKTAPEFNGKPFDKTFIYGASAGEVTFLEPMVTASFLKEKPSFSDEVKQPKAVQKAGYYPKRYDVRYLPERNAYQISLEGLFWRDASK